MALEPRVVSINFATGLDQKTDPKLTTKLTTADNVVLRKNGTIEKRLGFVADGSFSTSGNPVRAYPYNNGEFVLTDLATDNFADSFTNSSGTFVTASVGSQQHSIARIGSTWIPQEYTFPATIRTSNLISDSSTIGYSSQFIDVALCGVSATSSGFIVAVDSGNLAFVSYTSPIIYDLDTNLRSSAAIPFSLTYARVIAPSSTSLTAVIIGKQTFTDTTLCFCNVSNTSIASSISATITGVYPTPFVVDAVPLNGKIYFAAAQVTTFNLILGSYDPSNGALSTTVVSSSFTQIQNISVATPAVGTDRMRIFWRSSIVAYTVPVMMASYSFTLSPILANTAITVGVTGYSGTSTTTTGLIRTLSAVENIGATSVYLAYTQLSFTYINTSGPLYHTAWNALYSNTAVTIVSNDSPSTSGGVNGYMCSKATMINGRPSIMVNFNATAQSSLMLTTMVEGRITPIARCLFGYTGPFNSGALPTTPTLPTMASDGAGKFYTSAMKATSVRTINGYPNTNVGVALISINASQTQSIPSVKRQDCTYMGGGILSQYDGQGKIESGFYTSPIVLSVTVATSTTSLIPGPGTFAVVVVKEFTDQAGYTHVGQPSFPVTFTTSSVTNQASLVIVDGPTGIGLKRNGQIKYSIFRTQLNGSIYYRNSMFSITNGAGTSYTPIIVTVNSTDTSIASNDILYIQGGILPHWTPDSCDVLFSHKTRLFCNDPTNETTLRFSNEFVNGEAVAWSVLSTISIPGAGRITAGESLDSNAIVFRSRSIYAVSGDGPDETGSNGTFSEGQLVYADVGAINQSNVCRFSQGIIFKSQDKGFYMLSRDLQVTYVGAEVENYNSKTVVSSQVVALNETSGTAEECRFLCSDGTLLTYNYYNQQWTTATLSGCVDALQTGGRYVVVNTSSTVANGRVFQQSLSTYTDAFSNTSTTYQMTVETGWIKTADVQGFQRIWKAQLLGEAQGGGRVSVEVGYDYEASYNETYTFNMSSMTTPNYTGGAVSQPQVDLVPVRQKCQSIRFRFKDYPTENGVVMKLTNISLECGVKSGVFKLPAAKGS